MGANDSKDMKIRLNNAVTTLVGADATVSGNLAFRQGCHIAGMVKGDVIATGDKKSEVTVAQGGKVEGNVRAARMLIQGRVVGDLRCSGTLTLTASARVDGSIEYGQIEIEKGAVVTGSLVMLPAGSRKRAGTTVTHQASTGSANEVRAA